jgi:tetratricopeptide (TPR) repeat protein
MTEVDKGLTDEERKVMSGLSVLLDAGGTRDAIEVVLDAGGLRRALSSLSQRSLLETHVGEHGMEYGQNAMLQDFYYSFLGRSERRAMHHRAALYYEAEEPDLLKAAQHFLRAGEDEKALTLVTEAVGDLINKGQARPLLSLLKEVDVFRVTGAQRVKVRLALSQVQVTFGEYASAQEACQKALSELALLPVNEEVRELHAHACRWLARVHELRGEYGDALHWVRQGLAALQEQENSEAIELRLMAGLIHVRQGHYAEALDECRQGLRIAQTVNAPAVLARAYNLLGVIHLSDTTQLAIDPLQRAIALYEQVGDIRGQATSFNLMAGAYFNLGQWDQAEAIIGSRVRFFEKVGDAYTAFSPVTTGGHCVESGRLDDAQIFITGAGDARAEWGLPYVRGVLHNNLGAVYIQRGELEAAEVHLQTASPVSSRHSRVISSRIVSSFSPRRPGRWQIGGSEGSR